MLKTDRPMTINVQFKPKNVAQSMLVVAAFVLGLIALNVARHAVTLVVISAFLALALNNPVSWLSRHMPKKSRGLSTLVAYLIVLAILAGFVYIAVPPIVRQTQSLAHSFPSYLNNLQEKSHTVSNFIKEHNLQEQTDKFTAKFTDNIGNYGNSAFGAVQSIIGGLVSVITVLVLTFLMLIDGPAIVKSFWKTYTDKNKLKHHQELVYKMYQVVTGFVYGQVFITTIDAVAALIILVILRQPYALPLAGIIWITGLIPLMGATLGAIIVVLVALLHSPINAIILAVYFPIYHLIDDHSIQPYVQSKALNMSALLVFTSVVVGYSFGGILPALLALPVVGCVQVLVVDYLQRSKAHKSFKQLNTED